MMDVELKTEEEKKESYRPSRPIKFSHKVHQNEEIDCKYYHSNHRNNDPVKTSVCINCYQTN